MFNVILYRVIHPIKIYIYNEVCLLIITNKEYTQVTFTTGP